MYLSVRARALIPGAITRDELSACETEARKLAGVVARVRAEMGLLGGGGGVEGGGFHLLSVRRERGWLRFFPLHLHLHLYIDTIWAWQL